MRIAKSLQELAKEIERVEEVKKDLVLPTTKLEMRPGLGERSDSDEMEFTADMSLRVEDGNGGMNFDVSDHTHGQIASRLEIPKRYYDRMKREDPALLATNVNRWFKNKPERRMVRTLDGKARAFLSDRYRPFDNFLIAKAALPVLANTQDLAVTSSELTERRMYIQATTPRIKAEVKVGDVVQAGVMISNSEIGCGAVWVKRMIWRLVCSNGMVRGDALRKYHVGRRTGGGEDEVVEDFFRTETIEADHKAFIMKIEDTIRAAFDGESFDKDVKALRESSEKKLIGKIDDVIQDVTKRFGMMDGEGDGVLQNLIEGADLSLWGLANAVTAHAKNEGVDYDRGIELEGIGGQIIDLKPSDVEFLDA